MFYTSLRQIVMYVIIVNIVIIMYVVVISAISFIHISKNI